MNRLRVSKIFFKFANSAVDPGPNYNAPDSERIEWGLSALHGPDRRNDLSDLATCLKEMLDGLFTNAELNKFWDASNANIKHKDPKRTRALLEQALIAVERELGH